MYTSYMKMAEVILLYYEFFLRFYEEKKIHFYFTEHTKMRYAEASLCPLFTLNQSNLNLNYHLGIILKRVIKKTVF